MTNTPSLRATRSVGRAMASVVLALLIGAVLQLAAIAKIAHGAKILDQLSAARLAQANGLPPKVVPEDFQWIVKPGALAGTPLEHGVLLDIGLGIVECAVVLLAVAFCRRRFVWVLLPLMFAGFFGYALQKTIVGKPCGCFGSLWVPPHGVSIAMDGAFVVLGLGLALWHGAKRRTVIAAAIVALIAGITGYVYAARSVSDATLAPTQSTPAVVNTPAQTGNPSPTGATPTPTPAPTTGTPAERLVASDFCADLRTMSDTDAATYIFIWDPTCSTCEAMLPIVQMFAQQYADEGNPVLQIRDITKQDIERTYSIGQLEWDHSPTILIVRGGKIIQEYGGEGSPMPSDVSERLFNDEPIDDLQKPE